MDPHLDALIAAVHEVDRRVVLVLAGAGTQGLAWLLQVPGASRTLLEALVPYEWRSFDEFLGETPEQYVAASTARRMAGRALTRAQLLSEPGERVAGLACTATIVTDRPKRGEHRAHVATWEAERVTCYSLRLEKGARDRTGEEAVVSMLVLNALAAVHGITARQPLELGVAEELAEETIGFEPVATRLHRHEIPFFGIEADGRLAHPNARPQMLLSGAFNPLHQGHLELAEAASRYVHKSVAFELAASNVDKPRLPVSDVLARMSQFAGSYLVFASNAPTYVEKSRLYPGALFVVGYDTARRVLQPRYYGASRRRMDRALTEIAQNGCGFLIAGRLCADGDYRTAQELAIPAGHAELFRPLPDFRFDVSSSELRAEGVRGSR